MTLRINVLSSLVISVHQRLLCKYMYVSNVTGEERRKTPELTGANAESWMRANRSWCVCIRVYESNSSLLSTLKESVGPKLNSVFSKHQLPLTLSSAVVIAWPASFAATHCTVPVSPDWRLVNLSSFLPLIWILPVGEGETFAPLWSQVIVGCGIPLAVHANIAVSWGNLSTFVGWTVNVGWPKKRNRQTMDSFTTK